MAGKQTQSSPSQRSPIAVCRKNKANFCFYLLGIRRGGASRFFSSHRHLSLVTVLKREHELLDLAAPLFGVCDLPPMQAVVKRELLLGALLVLGADQSLSQAVMRVGEARVELDGPLVLADGIRIPALIGIERPQLQVRIGERRVELDGILEQRLDRVYVDLLLLISFAFPQA